MLGSSLIPKDLNASSYILLNDVSLPIRWNLSFSRDIGYFILYIKEGYLQPICS